MNEEVQHEVEVQKNKIITIKGEFEVGRTVFQAGEKQKRKGNGKIGVKSIIASVNTFLLKIFRVRRKSFYCVTEERSINMYLLCLSQVAEVPRKEKKCLNAPNFPVRTSLITFCCQG